MYGISNSQQQGGGGGGGAASYKAIKSTLTPSDWQEVAGATPYFVGDDATTWAKDSDTQQPIKISNSDLGITAGQQYTITIEANGVEYSSTATAESKYGMLMLMFTFSETANAMVMIYDQVDWAAGNPGNGSAIMVNPGQNTSLVITNFAGEGFGTIIQATISDSAIKVNSAVTMYTNTSEKIALGGKTNGNVTLIAPSIPTTEIPYSLEIVGTDTEGLFELVNGYIPEITPSAVPQWHTIFENATPVVSAEIGTNMIQPGQLYRVTVDMSGEANPDNYDMFIASSPGDYYIPFSQVDVSGSSPSSIGVIVFRIEYTTTTSGVIHLSPIARYEVTSAGITNFFAVNNVDTWKFTKLEVYR